MREELREDNGAHPNDPDFPLMDIHVDLARHTKTDLGIGSEKLARVLCVTELHDLVRITVDTFLRECRLHVMNVKDAHPRLRDLLLHAYERGSEVFACDDCVIEVHACILRDIPSSHHAPPPLRRSHHRHTSPLAHRLRTGSDDGTLRRSYRAGGSGGERSLAEDGAGRRGVQRT